MARFAPLLIAILIAQGCTNGLYMVRRPAPTSQPDCDPYDEDANCGAVMPSVPGIPFFIKKAVCRRETVYDEPRYTITLIEEILTAAAGERHTWKEVDRQSIELSLTGYRRAGALNLLAHGTYDEMTSDFGQILAFRNAACLTYPDSRRDQGLPVCPANAVLFADRSVREVVVDYGNPHYINTRRAWSGKSNASIELAPDGTLNKAEAEIEDTTLKTILDTLPISAYLSHVLGIASPASEEPAAEAKAAGRAPVTRRAKLEVETVVVRHRYWTVEAESKNGCKATGRPMRGDPGEASYEQTLLKPGDGAPAAAAKPSGNTISIAGSIELPKSDTSAEKPDTQ